MSLTKLIDKQIEEAIARGEFDGIEGSGKPIDLNAYFAAPADLRVGYSMLKSNKFVPEEVERLKEIGELRERLKACESEAEKQRLTKLLNEKDLALSIIIERNKRRK